MARELLSITDSAAGRFPAEAVPIEETGEVTHTDEADPKPAEEDIEPEDVFPEEQDPHVEPTAILPVVEPDDGDDDVVKPH